MNADKMEELALILPIKTDEDAEVIAHAITKIHTQIKELEGQEKFLKDALKVYARAQYDDRDDGEPVEIAGTKTIFKRDSLNKIPYDIGKSIKKDFADDVKWNAMLEAVWYPRKGCVEEFGKITKEKKKLFIVRIHETDKEKTSFIKEGAAQTTIE